MLFSIAIKTIFLNLTFRHLNPANQLYFFGGTGDIKTLFLFILTVFQPKVTTS